MKAGSKFQEKKPKPKQEKKCSVRGCDRMLVNGEKGAAGDLCGMHYRRFKRTGETGAAEKQRDTSRTHPLRVWIEPDLADRLRKVSGGASSPFARDAIERAILKAEKRAAAE